MLKENEYWHFAAIKDGKPVMRDGKPIIIGETYTVKKNLLCESGYHGSKNIIDALNYAPGSWLSIRKITDNVILGDDKVCGKNCTHIKGFDINEILREFARKCALDVIYLWDAPEVVVEYLKTGREELRDAARDAARAAAWDAARDAAWAAAWDAAWDATRDAAWDAARAAARDAARAAAWGKQNIILTGMVNKLFEGELSG